MLWKVLAKEIGSVLVLGASKAFYEYMSKKDPKEVIDAVVERVKPKKKKAKAKTA